MQSCTPTVNNKEIQSLKITKEISRREGCTPYLLFRGCYISLTAHSYLSEGEVILYCRGAGGGEGDVAGL